MKLRSKITSKEITLTDIKLVDGEIDIAYKDENGTKKTETYESLFGLYENYEDAVGFIITPEATFDVQGDWEGYSENDIKEAKELGLWYKTSEEAEKVAKNLKAFQRLKNIGFKFDGIDVINRTIKFKLEYGTTMACGDDLNLLFSGKDEQ